MYEDIAPGAAVECPDGHLGTLERLVHEQRTGNVSDLMVRQESTGKVFRIPLRYIAKVRTPKRVYLNCTIDQLESLAEQPEQLKERKANSGF